MQFKTENRPMITVYRADVANLRKTLASGVLYQQVVNQMAQHFNGYALRVDARIEFEDAAPCGMADARLIDIRALLGNMNIYTIVKIGMRLSDSCLDRWVEVDKRDTILRLDGALFGVRCTNGVQSEAANMYYVDLEAELLTAFGHRTTHIYIPSTENKEIPIYPCEPFGVKKVNPKPTVAESPTNPEAGGLWIDNMLNELFDLPEGGSWTKAPPLTAEQIKTAVAGWAPRTVEFPEIAPIAWSRNAGRSATQEALSRMRELFPSGGYTSGGLVDTAARPLLRPGELVEGNTKTMNFGRSPLVDVPARQGMTANPVTVNLKVDTSTAIGSFGKAVTDLSREIQVSNLKAAARNPELREALFKALRKDGDRETLTALFRLSQEALFGIKWDEVNGKARKPTK